MSTTKDFHNHTPRTKPVNIVDPYKVRVLLAQRSMTLSDLAEKMDVSISGLHYVVNGQRKNSPMVPRIAEALGVRVKSILAKLDAGGPLFPSQPTTEQGEQEGVGGLAA